MNKARSIVGYERFPPGSNPVEREKQRAALRSYGVERLLSETEEQDHIWQKREAAIETSGHGDTLVVERLEYLARSTRDLSITMKRLEERGVRLIVLSFAGRMLDSGQMGTCSFAELTMGMAEFESAKSRERNFAGLKAAKEQGKLLGRPRISDEIKESILTFHVQKGYAANAIAEVLKVSRATVFRVIREAAGSTERVTIVSSAEAGKPITENAGLSISKNKKSKPAKSK